MVIKHLSILALCLFLCTCASAQTIWLDGNYTLKSGKTVSGQVADIGPIELGFRFDYSRITSIQGEAISRRMLLLARYGLN